MEFPREDFLQRGLEGVFGIPGDSGDRKIEFRDVFLRRPGGGGTMEKMDVVQYFGPVPHGF